MIPRHVLLLLAFTALPGMAAGQGLQVLEQAVEATAAGVLLPASEPGMVVVTGCEGCAPQSFVTSARTRYLADGVAVTLRDLRAGLATASHASVTVLYDARTREVTRVIASGLPR